MTRPTPDPDDAGGKGRSTRDPLAHASRLERMVHRLVAQRTFLEHAATLLVDLPGPIFEVGLGKGRTYDHLRKLFPDREIYAFDREVHAPADCVPDAEYLILGEFRQTLPDALRRVGEPAALVHADVGSTDPARDRALVRDVSNSLAALVKPGGIMVSDRELDVDRAELLPAPANAGPWPYYLVRVHRASGQ